MLGDAAVTPTVAVKDLAAAKEFYEGVLGLQQTKENEAGVWYGSGASQLFLYESAEFAGTNKATYAGFTVDDVAATATALKQKGVNFLHFDLPMGGEWDGDVASWNGQMQSAWFTDPEGNTFALDSGMS